MVPERCLYVFIIGCCGNFVKHNSTGRKQSLVISEMEPVVTYIAVTHRAELSDSIQAMEKKDLPIK